MLTLCLINNWNVLSEFQKFFFLTPNVLTWQGRADLAPSPAAKIVFHFPLDRKGKSWTIYFHTFNIVSSFCAMRSFLQLALGAGHRRDIKTTIHSISAARAMCFKDLKSLSMTAAFIRFARALQALFWFFYNKKSHKFSDGIWYGGGEAKARTKRPEIASANNITTQK